MPTKNSIKVLLIIIILSLLLFLTGCISSSTDETQIMQIAENIKKSIEKKNVDLFMENISFDYSDSNEGTYDNHINGLPEEIFSIIEEAEDLVDFYSMFKIEPKVSIPEKDIVLAETYATGKMEIKITLKVCIAWVICTIIYNETREYNVDFIKEGEDWKIISLSEN
jgi:cell division protein FtsL